MALAEYHMFPGMEENPKINQTTSSISMKTAQLHKVDVVMVFVCQVELGSGGARWDECVCVRARETESEKNLLSC